MNTARDAIKQLPRRARHAWHQWRPRAAYWTAALVIGLVAAGFAWASERVLTLHSLSLQWAHWLMFLLTPLVFVAVAELTRRYAPDSAGSGIPQVLAALRNEARSLRDRVLSLRVATLKIVLTLVGMACGATIGREGPTVQVGAAIAHAAGRRSHSPHLQRSLILAGGAAGVAAAFNTPLAGIIFALEELASSLEEKSSGTLLVMVIIAAVVAMSILGNYSYFGRVDVHLGRWTEWRAVLICGLAGGLAGGLFARGMVALSRKAQQLRAAYGWRVPAVCGFIVAVLGLLSAGLTDGSGYAEARLALEGSGATPGWYPFAKAAALLASYASGIPGGIFSPSLAVGAGLGADLIPFIDAVPPQAVAVLGMAAYFAGVTGAPLTAAVIVSEMTLDQRMILPLMGTALLAAGTARLFNRESLYRALMLDLFAEPRRAPPPPASTAATPPDSPRPCP